MGNTSLGMIKNRHKTPKEQIVELHTGISIEQWEENNRKLAEIMKEKLFENL